MGEINFFSNFISLVEMVISSGFFIALLCIGIITIIAFILNEKIDTKKKPYIKVGIGIIYLILAIFIFYKYSAGILLIGDAFIEKLFTAIYFPNIISYMCMLIITLLLMIITFVNKRLNKSLRICNVFSFCLIGFLFILIIDAIVSNDINVYEKVSIYSNENLMILIQASMGVFVVWLSILIVNFLVNFITRRITNEDDYYLDFNVDDVIPYSDEDYLSGYVKYNNRVNYQEYQKFINNYEDYFK